MRSYITLYQWADSLSECGQMNEVGAGMIEVIKEKIREAYKNGFADSQKGITPKKVRTHRGVRGRNFSTSRTG